MSIEIVDVSDNNPYLVSLPSGVGGIIAKATEGNYHTDRNYARYQAQYYGRVPFAAYHYVTGDDPASQAARIADVVPVAVPIALDVEKAGSEATGRPLVAALRARGYRVVLTYWPHWFWVQVGQPSLAGLPPLWASNYTSGVVGWQGYGGNTVIGLQYTNSYAVDGHRYDMSTFTDVSFLTTRTPIARDEDMPQLVVPAGTDEHIELIVDGCTELYVATGYGDQVHVASLLWFGPTPAAPAPAYGGIGDEIVDFTVDANRPGPVPVPTGAVVAVLRYTASHAWTLAAR